MTDNLMTMWQKAASMDLTLSLQERDLPALREKRIQPISYSRLRLFSRMARGQVSLFNDFSVPLKSRNGFNKRALLAETIRNGFPVSATAGVQTGRARWRSRVKVPELIRRWEGGRAIISVTDLHFRGTKFDTALDTSALSDFNILCHDPVYKNEFIDQIEMMTLVVSSERNVTDNHADDCDGSNHCFIGRKLWLAWDRMEGKARGFQDIDRDEVEDYCAFDMKTFLSLSSSSWFLVEPDLTLFLPGNLAHKVITLEPYIGVGSFHVALPSYLRALKRWIFYDTCDIGPKNLLEKINEAVLRRVHRLRGATPDVQEHWGFSYMKKAVRLWDKQESFKNKNALMKHPVFASFYRTALEA